MNTQYKQRALWPIFDEEKTQADSFAQDLVIGLGIPEKFAGNTTMTSFSDGSVSVTLKFDLTSEQVLSYTIKG